MRVDFLRLRFDGALDCVSAGLQEFDETSPDDELARLGVVEKGDFTFGFFRLEAFLLLLCIIVVLLSFLWSSVVFDVITQSRVVKHYY